MTTAATSLIWYLWLWQHTESPCIYSAWSSLLGDYATTNVSGLFQTDAKIIMNSFKKKNYAAKRYCVFTNVDNNVIWIVNDRNKNPQLLTKEVAQYLNEHMGVKLCGKKCILLNVLYYCWKQKTDTFQL